MDGFFCEFSRKGVERLPEFLSLSEIKGFTGLVPFVFLVFGYFAFDEGRQSVKFCPGEGVLCGLELMPYSSFSSDEGYNVGREWGSVEGDCSFWDV